MSWFNTSNVNGASQQSAHNAHNARFPCMNMDILLPQISEKKCKVMILATAVPPPGLCSPVEEFKRKAATYNCPPSYCKH